MNLRKAALLLLSSFFFTVANGCRTTLRLGDVPLVAELVILQSIAIEAHEVHPVDTEPHVTIDNPERSTE